MKLKVLPARRKEACGPPPSSRLHCMVSNPSRCWRPPQPSDQQFQSPQQLPPQSPHRPFHHQTPPWRHPPHHCLVSQLADRNLPKPHLTHLLISQPCLQSRFLYKITTFGCSKKLGMEDQMSPIDILFCLVSCWAWHGCW